MTWRQRLGELLFTERTRLGLSMAEVARRGQVSRQTLYTVEYGDSDPCLSTFVNLCQAVGLDPSDTLRRARSPGDHTEDGT